MKSLTTLFLSLIITLFTVACQSDNLHECELSDRVAVDVSLSIDNSSRISYTSDFALAFSPNDKMEIMERNLMDITTLVYNYDLGQFLGKIYVPRDAESYIVCTHVGAKTYSAEKATFEISSSQIGAPGVYLAGLWELTDFQDLSLQMAQMSSMLAFTVNPTADGISEIILESVAGEMIAGTVEYDYDKLEYSLTGTSSKISVKPVASPTSATQYVINILPVSLSKGAYLTIVDKKGNKMRLTLNYDQVCNFDVNKVVILPDVINQQNVGVELGKVYSSYTVDEVPTPNNDLDGSTIWIEQSRSVGISTALVKEAGLYVDGVKHVGSYSSDGVISALTLSSQNWAEHSIEAYIVDLDGVEVRSAAKSVAVTGLPYSYSFSGATEASVKAAGWILSEIRAVEGNCVKFDNESYLLLPSFYIPTSVNVTSVINCVTNEETSTGRGFIYLSPSTSVGIANNVILQITPPSKTGLSTDGDDCKEVTSEEFELLSNYNSLRITSNASFDYVVGKCYSAIAGIVVKYAN